MAIKVIKRAYRKETARATCSTCGSILEYSKEDIKNSGPMSSDDDYWITCPVCNDIIYFVMGIITINQGVYDE